MDTSEGSPTPGEKLEALVELCGQARNRFREIESVEWRVNFTVWGFLAAAAYAVMFAERPIQVRAWSLWLVAVPLLHFWAVFLLNQSGYFWRQWAAYFRDKAKAALDLPTEGRQEPPDTEGLTKRHWAWIVVETVPTVLGTVGLITLAW